MTTTPSESSVLARLESAYPEREWATFRQLAIGTGGNAGRTIDLLAMNLFPSQGLLTLAFEVKVSKSDWRRELDDLGKTRAWDDLVHETWFAAPAGVIPVAEVPEGYGLVELLSNGTLRRPKRARRRDLGPTVPRSFLAALARRTADPPPPPPEVFELLGRPVRVADLERLADALVRRGRLVDVRRRDAQAAAQQDEHRRLEREGNQKAWELLHKVRQLCGWNVRTAADFETWMRAQGPRPVLSHQDTNAVRRAIELLQDLVPPAPPAIPGME